MSKVSDLEFQVEGQTLRGKLYEADKSKPLAILFVHGWTGLPNATAAEVMADNGFTSLVFSLRGHNDSDGTIEEVTREGSLKDVVGAYDFLKVKSPDSSEVVAAGSSYGSYMSAILSSKRPLAAMSLRVPANYPDEHADKPQLPQAPDSGNTTLNEWRKQMAKYDSTMSLVGVHEFKGSIQIIEAQNDEVVPHQTVQNYIDAVTDKTKLDYHFMEGWPHSLGDDLERNHQYQQILLNWLNKQI